MDTLQIKDDQYYGLPTYDYLTAIGWVIDIRGCSEGQVNSFLLFRFFRFLGVRNSMWWRSHRPLYSLRLGKVITSKASKII